jgi:hypothetical protein
MPIDVGSSVTGVFSYLKDRVWKKVQGWMEQCLSTGGKEVLIKVVAQAIPMYSMACFRLPRGLCKHIDGLLRDFWWGSKEGKQKTCWVAWDDMSMPKGLGVLGFRNIELFNLALLGAPSLAHFVGSRFSQCKGPQSSLFPSNRYVGSRCGFISITDMESYC